jgi:hypothetical protein
VTEDERAVASEMLEAEEAHRLSATLGNASRLARARRALEEAIRYRSTD